MATVICHKHQRVAPCPYCGVEKLQAHVQKRIDDVKASIKHIKGVCNGNATRGSNQCISNDIPTSKTTSQKSLWIRLLY